MSHIISGSIKSSSSVHTWYLSRNFMSDFCQGRFSYTLLLLLLVNICSYHDIFSQDITVRASIDTTDMLIGDQLPLNVEVSYPDDIRVFWPSWLDTLGRMEIVSRTELDSLTGGGNITQMQTLYLTAFDSGAYQIPPLNFYYTSTYSNDTLSKTTNPLDVFVHTVPVDTSQAIKAIKTIQPVPITFREIFPWILIAVIILAIIGGVIYWNDLRKKRKPAILIKKEPEIPPHEVALEKLDLLEHKKLWQEGRVKEYYVELTEIIREYLEGRYNIPARESTTEEIIRDLKRKDITAEQMAQLQDLLQRADLTKFAKSRPGPEENRKSLDVSRNFVQMTREIIIAEDMAEAIPQPTQTTKT